MLEWLKEKAYMANMLLPKYGLVTFTWGNVSEIDRETGIFAIKPSGVEYDELKPEDMVLVDLDGKKVEGEYNPSSDTDTHLVLYRSFNDIGGVVHTHSPYATMFAQAGKGIAALGTTHADYFYGEIPCTRRMTPEEIASRYEYETGNVIVEEFADKDPNDIPGVLVNSHGPFSWGKDAGNAVHNAVVMEECAKMALGVCLLNGSCDTPMQKELLDKHYLRKHGKDAYYGQIKKSDR